MKRTFFKYVLVGVVTIFLSELAHASSSQPWVTSRVELKCEPTGVGLVYASTGSGSVNNCTSTTYTATNGRTHNTNVIPQTFNIYTKPADATRYNNMIVAPFIAAPMILLLFVIFLFMTRKPKEKKGNNNEVK